MACLVDIHIVAGYHDTEAASPSTVKQDEYRLTYATSTNTHQVAATSASPATAAIMGINQGGEQQQPLLAWMTSTLLQAAITQEQQHHQQ